MPKKRINICITEEKWQRFQRHAAQRRVSASAAVEEVIDKVLEDEERQRRGALEEILAINLGPMGTPEELCAELSDAHVPCGFEDDSA